MEVLRQAWQIEKSRLSFYWHHPWVIVLGVLVGIAIWVVMAGGFMAYVAILRRHER